MAIQTVGPEELASYDIYDALRQYIIGDYQQRSIVITDRVLSKKPVYLEGHVDVHFKECMFSQQFFAGIPGPRFEGDDRGTEANPEPFPEYGYNVITFENCTINAEMKFADNCTVIFIGGTINSPVTGSDNCRFVFDGGVQINTPHKYENRCEIISHDAKLNASPQTFEVSDKTFVTLTQNVKINCETPVKASDGCEVYIRGIDNIPVQKTVVEASDSKVEIHSVNTITSQESTFKLSNKSILKLFTINEITSQKSLVESDDSSFYCSNLQTVTTQDTTFKLSGSGNGFCEDVQNVTSSNKLAEIYNAGLDVKSIQSISCASKGIELATGAFYGTAIQSMTCGAEIATFSDSVVIFEDCETLTASSDGFSGTSSFLGLYTVNSIIASSNLINTTLSVVEDENGTSRQASNVGYELSSGRLFVRNQANIAVSDEAFKVSNVNNVIVDSISSVSAKTMLKVDGLSAGSSSQLAGKTIKSKAIEKIRDLAYQKDNPSNPSVHVQNISGISVQEKFVDITVSNLQSTILFADISDVSCPSDAIKVSGTAYRFVASNISKLCSAATALNLPLSNCEIIIDNIPIIQGNDAILLSGYSTMEVSNVSTIYALTGTAVSISGAKAVRLKEIESIIAVVAGAISVSNTKEIDILDEPTIYAPLGVGYSGVGTSNIDWHLDLGSLPNCSTGVSISGSYGRLSLSTKDITAPVGSAITISGCSPIDAAVKIDGSIKALSGGITISGSPGVINFNTKDISTMSGAALSVSDPCNLAFTFNGTLSSTSDVVVISNNASVIVDGGGTGSITNTPSPPSVSSPPGPPCGG